MARTIELEICVDDFAGVLAAKNGGADRVELCAALSEGGLTPSYGLMKAASTVSISTFAMIRPRAGLFHYSGDEINLMIEDIQMAKSLGLKGVVLGAQSIDGDLDINVLRKLIKSADGLGVCLHRVVDVLPDPLHAVDQAIDLGIDRILSSGGAEKAPDGTDILGAMVARAAGRIEIMAGSGVTAKNAAKILRETGADALHASCAEPDTETAFSNFSPLGGLRHTSQNRVREMTKAISQANH